MQGHWFSLACAGSVAERFVRGFRCRVGALAQGLLQEQEEPGSFKEYALAQGLLQEGTPD